MNSQRKKRYIFHISGASVVVFWLFMMAILIINNIHKDDPFMVNRLAGGVPISSVQREWKEIFLNDRKVGYSMSIINPVDEGYFIQEEIFLKMNLSGFERGLHAITQSGVDNDFLLKNFFFRMTSGVINYTATGEVDGSRLVVSTGPDRRSTRRSVIELKTPPMINSAIGHLFKTIDISVGDSHRIPFFDPSMMAQHEAVFTVAALEEIVINRISYEAFRIETEMWGNRLSFWLDRDGSVLREEGFMGLVMIKSSAANAPINIETGEMDDFYEISAVPVDKKIPDHERLTSLRLKIKNAAKLDLNVRALSDEIRQKYYEEVIEIIKEEIPSDAGFSLPFDDEDRELLLWLNPEFNIESDEKEIIDKAFSIIGDNREPVSAARNLMEWVYKNLEKVPVVNVPSALEVIRSRRGDCNEHATLLTALLRAAGIPSRVVVGLAYTRDRFYYHAWTEAYLGEWITMDATLNQMPADVTHISIARGGLDSQVEIIGFIGKLDLEVLDYKYD